MTFLKRQSYNDKEQIVEEEGMGAAVLYSECGDGYINLYVC